MFQQAIALTAQSWLSGKSFEEHVATSGTAVCLASWDPDNEMVALPHNIRITKSTPIPVTFPKFPLGGVLSPVMNTS